MARPDRPVSDAGSSFGKIAASYAELRPAYPDDLFDFLLARLEGPRATCIDLGAGSGQASRSLIARFSHVIAVEPDARMLAHLPDAAGVEKVNAPAEMFDAAPGSADCVTAATSFHWMDQDVVVAGAARWLRAGGVFFPFLYGPFFVQGPARAVYEAHWRLWAPHMDRRLGAKADYSRSIRANGAFGAIETYTGRAARRYAPEEAAALLFTASYARAYAEAEGKAETYADELAREIAAVADDVDIEFPLGGVLAVRT